MATVLEIKQAILDLPKAEYIELMEWLREVDEEEWDRQIEADALSGKFDFPAAEAWEAKASGTLTDL